MLCSKEDIKVYEGFDTLIKNGDIRPYEEDLVEFLNTHTDFSGESYIDQLTSTSSTKLNFKLARYLMIYLKDKGALLMDGKLSTLRNGNFEHYWIEQGDSVYDTTFIGKWDKGDFYDLFKPTDIEVVDLDKDIDYELFVKNNRVIPCSEYKELEYFDWYRYNKNNTINVFPIAERLYTCKYPKQYTRKLVK